MNKTNIVITEDIKKYFVFIILIFTFLIYINTIQNGFVYDDRYTILKNSYLKDIKNIKNLFNLKYFEISGAEQTYRPVVTFTYFIDYAMWGEKPTGYHFVNVLLHIITAIVIYFLLKKLFNDQFFAFITTMLYTAHPALTEAVNCISYREDILATLFYTASFLFYLKSSEKFNFYILFSFLFFLLALFSKEMAITLPFVIIIYDFFLKEKNSNLYFTVIKNIKTYLLYIAIALFYLYILFTVFKHPSKSEFFDNTTLLRRIIFTPYNLFHFFKIAIFPFFLNADYYFSYPKNLFDLYFIISTLFFVVIIITIFIAYNRDKTLFFGMLFFLITLIPVLNIIKIYKPFADRYLYLPLIGFSIFISRSLFIIFKKIPSNLVKRLFLFFSIIILFLTYSFLTINRNKVWKDEFTLWRDVIKKNPMSENANNNLGALYYIQNNFDQAEKYYKKAIEINPKSDTYYINLAMVYMKKADYDKAEKELFKAIDIYPNFYLPYELLGFIYQKKEILDKAVEYYQKSLALNSQSIKTLENLGELYILKGKKREALVLFEEILKINPENNRIKEKIGNLK